MLCSAGGHNRDGYVWCNGVYLFTIFNLKAQLNYSATCRKVWGKLIFLVKTYCQSTVNESFRKLFVDNITSHCGAQMSGPIRK